MEDNKVENIQESMKYYCRVCTSNTKSKKAKCDDCIGIFKRIGLKSILEKYLQLQISEDDPLPKVICRSCFEKVEAIEVLRVMAKRTETLLRDFLKNRGSQPKLHSQFQNEYNNFAISKSTPRPQPKNEVVVNVSLSDPLTKDINKKLLVAQRKKESLEKAFTPSQISRSAVTSSPTIPPVTIVHQMPRKKLPVVPNLLEKRKKLQMALTNATTVTLENPPPVPVPRPIKLPMRPKTAAPAPLPLRHISEAPAIPQKVEIHPVITDNTHTLGHGLTLGSIIKDEDLLRLILKALKWPFNNQTLGIQIQRLKNTNFSDVIVDPNLLQDADLIQILGPLIHPTLVPLSVAPQQHTYHINVPPEPVTIPPATISYKLPAETSVQIITVPLEESTTSPSTSKQASTSKPRSTIKKRSRYVPIAPKQVNSVIVVSDESDDDSLKALTANEEIQRFEVQLDPAMYPGVGENSNSNETMLATLNRQREAMMRMHRSKRKQSLIGVNVEMVDDIMIVDEGVQMNDSYPEVVLVKKPRKTHIMPPMASASSAKTISTVPASQSPKRITVPPPPPPPMPQIPATLHKLPTLPAQKLPALQPILKKVPQTDTPPVTKITKKNDINSPNHPSTLLYNFKNTTLADADSTTKIVIKESKMQKPQNISSDIEEHITKVRIEKQMQASATAQNERKDEKSEESSDDDLVLYMEYEDVDEDAGKETEIQNEKKKEELEMADLSPEVIKQKLNSPVEARKTSNDFELPAIEIKEEDLEIDISKETSESVKEEESTRSNEKKEHIESAKSTNRSFIASKTATKKDLGRQTRSSQKRKIQQRKESPIAVVTTFRPARKSKTLSKYYKGPPTAGLSARSMRSRT